MKAQTNHNPKAYCNTPLLFSHHQRVHTVARLRHLSEGVSYQNSCFSVAGGDVGLESFRPWQK